MSKFCQTCGKVLADDMRFCDGCGAPAPAAAPAQAPQQPVYQQPAPQQPVYQQAPQQPVYQQPTYQQAPQQPVYQQQPTYQQQPAYQPAPVAAPAKPAKKSNIDLNKIFDQVKMFANGVVNRCKVDKKFMITCCGIAAAVVLVIILACVLLFGSNETTPIDTLINVTFKGKANQIKNLAPNEYWEYMEDEYDESLDDMIDDYKDNWEDMEEELEDYFGKNIRVTYKVDDKDELSKKELKAIAKSLDSKYDIDRDKVTAGYELELEMTIKGSEEEEDMDTTITVVKIGGKWYAVNYSEYSGASFILDIG